MPGQWVRNELWRRAKAVPSLDLRFAENKSLTDAASGQSLVTFTRASTGTYVGSDGLVKTAAVDAPRFDHNPTTGESLGLLVEEARTNLLLQSNGFDTTWTNSNSSETASAGTAPDGTNTAWELKDTLDASPVIHNIGQPSIAATSGVAYTFSVFAKAKTLPRITLLFPAATFTTATQSAFDLTAGTVPTTGANSTTSITAFGNGWYRCAMTMTATATSSGTFIIRLSDGSAATYQGAGTGTVLLWGAQVEAGAFPTSYIPTTTATVTRSADVASIITIGASIRSLFTRFRSPASGTRGIVSLDDNTANNRIELLTSTADPKLTVTSSGSAQADVDAGSITANAESRLAARFATDNFAASVAGGTEVVDTSGSLPVVTQLRIGSQQAGNYLNGPVARVTAWDTPLANIQTLTQ